jgi:DNA (cytosine-5)-methyltransferase 1
MVKYSVMDLFCGVGGFSLGFQEEGFDVKLGLDNWQISLDTFKRNHDFASVLCEDVTLIKDNYYKKLKNNIDVIIAGPPCQGFSMSGKREVGDKRNNLFKEVIRAVKLVDPKIVIIENVVGLLSMKTEDGIFVKDLIIKELDKCGYSADYKVLNAVNYGVPQARKRVIFIGTKNSKIVFPREVSKKIIVGDALGNVPNVNKEFYLSPETKYQKEMASAENVIFNHVPMKHNPAVLKRISFVPKGGNWQDIPKDIYNVGGIHSNNYRRLDPTKPSITMKHATKSMIIHPKFNRVITVREAARLQSFPDNFVFEGTVTEQHQQLANAVPPLLGRAIAKAVKTMLGEIHE